MTPRVELPKCRARCKSGRACRNEVYVAPDNTRFDFCYFHSPVGLCPELDKRREENRRKGGLRGKHDLSGRLRKALSGSRSSEHVVAVLGMALEAVLQDEIPARQAQAVSSLSNALLRALEARDTESRLDKLEALAAGDTGGATLQALLRGQNEAQNGAGEG